MESSSPGTSSVRVTVKRTVSTCATRWVLLGKTNMLRFEVQFLCPKMNHLSVDEKFSIRTPKVTKKFRFLYNKGVVHDDGTITSFYN